MGGTMVKLSGETEAQRKERKRLKKLAKAAAASENGSESAPTDASFDADTSLAPTLSKERKKLKKDKNKNIATCNGDVEMVVNGEEGKENGVKKNKKRKHENGVQNGNESLVDFLEKQDDSNDAPKKKKKKKKTQDDGEPVAKREKKEKEEKKVQEEKWEPEQKGAFRKIFYKPTESTTNMPDEE